jgi:hypothetical protein
MKSDSMVTSLILKQICYFTLKFSFLLLINFWDTPIKFHFNKSSYSHKYFKNVSSLL